MTLTLDPEVALKAASEALDQYAAAELASLPAAAIESLMTSVEQLRNKVDAAATRTAAAFDAVGAWVEEGARSASVWIAWQCLLDPAEARQQVRCGRALRSMPASETAFLAGTVTFRHVQSLVAAWRTNPDAFAEGGEDLLVEAAATMDAKRFTRAVRYWRYYNDPDRAEGDAVGRYERREAHCSTTFEDMVELRATLAAVNGAIFAAELARLEHDLWERDWAETRAALGDMATPGRVQRTAAQRRADALTEMAKRSAAMPAHARQARPLITVHVDRDTLLGRICELSDGTVVTPGEVLPLLVDFDLERVLFGARSRVLDVGVRQRVFTGATRRAVEVRDRECSHDSCHEPADRSQVHHDIDYEHGGLTIQDNGKLYCPFHHRRHHRQQPNDDDDWQ